jgi:S-DNA-T family DNA segregation ATPase FtsK/SpoIIIE
MASRAAGDVAWRGRARRIGTRGGAVLGALCIVAVALMLGFALLSYHPSDPSLMTAAGGPPQNVLGAPGAWTADLLLTLFGVPSALLLPPLIVVALRLWRGVAPGRWKRALPITILAMLACDIALGLLRGTAMAPLPAGLGGALGLGGAAAINAGLGMIQSAGWVTGLRVAAMALFAVLGLAAAWWSLGLDADEKGTLFRRRFGDALDEEEEDLVEAPASIVRTPAPARPRAVREPEADLPEPPRPTISTPVRTPQPSARGQRERQAKLALGDTWTLPMLDLLAPPPPQGTVQIDKAALERNARLLETVLEDFHVRGHITEVRPGPVVTMYELEPAAGIKASRVVAAGRRYRAQHVRLVGACRGHPRPHRDRHRTAQPEARNRLAVRTDRSHSFENHAPGSLALILGKNIAGDPVIADLAPMPHLLVAGTTGSGKSVGLNAMILSLLYRLTPDQCRMIMIDPKMLELSVYDDIPHLLSPVVTEPAKAIRALKWTVEQMEERYRMMATVQVSQPGLASTRRCAPPRPRAKRSGAASRPATMPTAASRSTRKRSSNMSRCRTIVVVVDELADLMMTAGKEVEFLIQRLAQKARAAGIHLIMATQRPSVDVITGVIKANLPTRISFQVASKIDSRTILASRAPSSCWARATCSTCPAASSSSASTARSSATRRCVRSPNIGGAGPAGLYHSGHRGAGRRRLRDRRPPTGPDDPETQPIARRSSSWSRVRRPRPRGSSASSASATTARG